MFICSAEFNLKWSIAAYATSYWCGTRCDLCLTEKHIIAQASQNNLLKLLSANFYQIFIFSPNDSPLKLWKMLFISPQNLFSFSWCSNFFSFLSSFQIQKDKWKWNNLSSMDLHKFPEVIFGITQKLYITSSNRIQEYFWTSFVTWRATGH